MTLPRPNILLFFPDQLRPDWVGPQNSGKAQTPHMDRLVARGVTFSNAICPSPLCGPSRACMATGREYDRNPVPNNKFSLDPDAPNFYRQLARAGYQVLSCGKADLLKGEHDWGADGQHADPDGTTRQQRLGFTGGLDSAGKHATIEVAALGKDEPYLAFLRAKGLEQIHIADMAGRKGRGKGLGPNFTNTAPSPLPDDAYQDVWVADCGLDCLKSADPLRPWFLQVNFVGPHEPMNITQDMAAQVADRDVPLPADLDGLTPEDHRQIRRNYTAMVELLDSQLGRFIDQIRSAGQLENTVIIIASDHGEMLGDAARWKKSQPHQGSIAVPLIVAGPKIAAGLSTDQPATVLDLHATILDLAGAAPLEGTDSRSLVPALVDPARTVRSEVYSGLEKWRLVFDGKFKMVAGFDTALDWSHVGNFSAQAPSEWRLVLPAEDVTETIDQSATYPEIAADLRQKLASQLREAGLPV